MQLYVLGNGFDLAHRLPTTYSDFRDYLEEKDWEYLWRVESFYELSSDCSRERALDYLWKNFEYNLGVFDGDNLIDQALSMDLGLDGGDFDIKDTLDGHWEREYDYIKNLQSLLKEWVETINIEDILHRTNSIQIQNSLFLNFNYTLLLEEVYLIPKNQVLHIHGSIDEEYGEEPVIGHGNSEAVQEYEERAARASEKYNEKESSICNALARYAHRTLKDTPRYLINNLGFFNRFKLVDRVFVIGHSIGDVDMPYFRYIHFITPKNTEWFVYYYSEHEKNIFKEKILSIGVQSKNLHLLQSNIFFQN